MPRYQTYALLFITNAKTMILKIALRIYKKTFDRTSYRNHIFKYLILKINFERQGLTSPNDNTARYFPLVSADER